MLEVGFHFITIVVAPSGFLAILKCTRFTIKFRTLDHRDLNLVHLGKSK